jgi:hypothetical protein
VTSESAKPVYGYKRLLHSMSERLQELASFLIKKGSKGNFVWYVGIFFIAFVFFGYYFSVWFYMTDFPINDDYAAILGFITEYNATSEWYDKASLIFSQHNEHRIFFSRICTLLYYKMNDVVNFASLNFIGNLSLILVCFIVQRSSASLRNNILYAIPVFFLILNFRHFELAFWAMASLQNFWVIAFAFAALYFLGKENTTDFILAFLFALMACFNSGNGMMTFIAGSLMLFLNRGTDKKFWLWMLISCISILFYFLTYKQPTEHPDALASFMNDPGSLFLYGLSFLGASVTLVKEKAMILGIVLLVLTFLLWRKKYYKINFTISAFIVFILLTAAINSLARFSMGVFNALSPRYSIYSVLLITCLYISFTELYKGRWREVIVLVVLLLSVSFHIWSYDRFIPYAIARKENFQQLRQVNYIGFDFGVPDFNKEVPEKWLKIADSTGLYKFPYKKQIPEMGRVALSEAQKINYSIDRYEEDDSIVTIYGWALLPKQNTNIALPLIRVVRDSVVVKNIFCDRSYRADVQKVFSEAKGSKFAGFGTEIPKKELSVGIYTVDLCMIDGDSMVCEKSIKKIEIKR